MKTLQVIEAASVLIGLSCVFCGCGPRAQSGFGNREISWSRSEPGTKGVPGIDEAEVDFGTWGAGAALVVWSDRGCSLGASGMGGRELQPGQERRGVMYEGSIAGPEGSTWKLECYTQDGKTGRVAIGDESFELAQGALFLVSTTGPKLRVKQLKLAMLNIAPEGAIPAAQVTLESLQKIARTNEDVRSFFTEAASSK